VQLWASPFPKVKQGFKDFHLPFTPLLSVAERFERKWRKTKIREGQGQGQEEGLGGARWRNGGGGAYPTE